MKNFNENIIFYRAWWTSLADKSPDFRHAVLDAVFAYAFDEITPSFPTESGQQIAFENISSFIDQNRDKFTKKQAQRKAAIEARWNKQKENNNTDAYEPIQNENSYSPARPNKDKDKDKVKDNVKDKDNTSKKEDKSFFSPNSNNDADAEKKEKIIFDYSLFLLSEGRVSAYMAAVKAYDYNDALDWQRETERRDGSVVHQPIRYKLAWLKSGPEKPPQEFDASHGKLLADILCRTSMQPESSTIIDHFRGCAIRGDCLYFLYSVITPAIRSFAKAIDQSPKINTIVSQEIARVFPDVQSFAVIKKSDL